MSASAREQLKQTPVTDSLRDLRGTIDFLRQEGDLVETDTPVNPDLEITGVQKHLDGSCPLLFNNVVGKPDHRAVTNLFADQGIMCKLFGVNNMTEMTVAIANAIRNPLPPVVVGIHRQPERVVDVRRVLHDRLLGEEQRRSDRGVAGRVCEWP